MPKSDRVLLDAEHNLMSPMLWEMKRREEEKENVR